MALFSPVRRTTVCEGGEQKIDCQGDQKLEIVSADFGRWDRGVCKGFLDMDWHTNCHTPKALEITKKECDGLSSCVLHAKVSEYGDPCVTIKKYLTVCTQQRNLHNGGKLRNGVFVIFFIYDDESWNREEIAENKY